MTFNFVKRRFLFYLISLVLIVPGVISLVLPGGLRPGIDFSSGTIMTLRFERAVEVAALREAFDQLNHPEAIVQESNDNTFEIGRAHV